ncbi:MAG: malto-oligosyltrehalose synthase [Acetobacteraceae bacterium]
MRLQLHRDFTFSDAQAVVPYLQSLGCSHLYASPILQARAGSIHGYDVVDPTRVNPELGGENGLRDLVAALRQAGLGLIVDIVPNHMAVGSDDNPWWTDVLRHGRASRYASYFDIDWECDDPDLRGKVLAPFLGKPYGQALADGDIRLDRTAAGEPVIRYYDASYPLDPASAAEVAKQDPSAFDAAHEEGRRRLHELLERQHYRLAWWGTAADEINWRRFFDINGLAGLRIEDDAVFEAAHATLFRLYAEGLIDGFRVDHVDGLSDPPAYCRHMRARLRELDAQRPADAPSGPAYLVVEKILGQGEALAEDWGVDGTSGYDFMDSVSALQHDARAETALSRLWASLSGRPCRFEDEETAARQEILERGFEAQLAATAAAFHRLARRDLVTRDISAAAIRRGLIALLRHFPVYRGYNAGSPRSEGDEAAFARALEGARADSPAALHPVLAALDRWMGGEPGDEADRDLRRLAGTRLQQLSAPVAAKAVEDTAFYRYGRLLSRNDVGFDATRLGADADRFHAACRDRLAHFPDSMLATATHDHKRGEDVRARMAVLSEMPDAWAGQVRAWQAAHRGHHDSAGQALAPGDELMLYQMIVGAWPPDLDIADGAGVAAFRDRLAGWQMKALREAKLATGWVAPNEAYEAAARDFLATIMADRAGFLADVGSLLDRIGPAGAVNGLAQMVLKLTVPGVPDFFQGTEFWDDSLVDPDNRRPVDFAARITALSQDTPLADLLADWRDGRIKQAIMTRILAIRRAAPELFRRGTYVPLAVEGSYGRHVVAFARTDDHSALLVVVPRLPLPFVARDGSLRLAPHAWENTAIPLPAALRNREFRSVLGDSAVDCSREHLPVDGVLGACPVAVFVDGIRVT